MLLLLAVALVLGLEVLACLLQSAVAVVLVLGLSRERETVERVVSSILFYSGETGTISTAQS